jgi:hypothetical protein
VLKTAPPTYNRLLKHAGFVTFTQQLSSFCRQKGKKPKKAAFAPVFGFPDLK